MKNYHIPELVLNVCRTLKDAGYDAYLVGGCVRDLVVSREPKDWDVTTNASPEDIQRIFPETFYENLFGTVGIVTGSEDERLKVVEITPYRIESGYTDARRPEKVQFGTSLSNDLKRRDFTINAIAYDPISHVLVDEHCGVGDLKKKLIRTVGDPEERFHEDALRMMRAIRLGAELDFAIDPGTLSGIMLNASQLEKVSRERIRDEFIRIVMSPSPMQAIFISQKVSVLKYIIPDLDKAVGILQNQAHSFDVFEHLLRSMQHAADKGWELNIRLAALLHDIGKPNTRRWSNEKEDWTFYGHEVVGANMARKILQDLRFSRETIDTVITLIRWHMFFSDPETITLSAVRRIIANVGKENIQDLLNLRICDRIGTGRPKEQPFRLRKYMSMVAEALRDPITVGMLGINGKDIMDITDEKPGPRLGWVLHSLLEDVLDDPNRNNREYLENKARDLLLLSNEELKKIGQRAQERKLDEEAAEIEKIRDKFHVK